MEASKFFEDHCFKFETYNQNDFTYVAVSKVIKRKNHEIIDSEKTTFDIHDTNRWLDDSQTIASTSPIDWDILTNEIKKTHIAYFLQRIPIENHLDLKDTMDINKLYC
ncbi:MAG: hypothetical protein WAS55_13255 [Saprospiraceae bacterium]